MNCKKCGNALSTQDSTRYPYVCRECDIAYGPWISAPMDEYTERAHAVVETRMKAQRAHDERRAKVI